MTCFGSLGTATALAGLVASRAMSGEVSHV